MKLAKLVLLTVLISLLWMTAVPIVEAGPFIEYQDVPVYIDGYGYCVLRKTTITMSNGDTYYDEQLIC